MLIDAHTHVRAMTEADVDQVLVIERESFSSPWSKKAFRECLQSAPTCWVIEVNNTIAGYSLNMPVADEFHILNIAVSERFRRRGLGAQLLEFSLHAAGDLRLRDAYLEVRVTNDSAIALYEKFGFARLMRRKKYYPDGEDAFVMHCPVAQQND